MRWLKNKKQLINELKEKDKTIYQLKKDHQLELFKAENKQTLNKYHDGYMVGSDLVIINRKIELKPSLSEDNQKQN